MSRKQLPILVAGIFIAAVVCAVFFLFSAVHHYGTQTVPIAYSNWIMGELVITYLIVNDDRWPDGWDDLVPLVRQQRGGAGDPARD